MRRLRLRFATSQVHRSYEDDFARQDFEEEKGVPLSRRHAQPTSPHRPLLHTLLVALPASHHSGELERLFRLLLGSYRLPTYRQRPLRRARQTPPPVPLSLVPHQQHGRSRHVRASRTLT